MSASIRSTLHNHNQRTMRHYSIYTLDANGHPVEKWQLSSDNLNEEREYIQGLQAHNPTKTWWIRDNHTGLVVF